MKHTSYPILCAAAIAGLSPMSLQGETPSPSVQATTSAKPAQNIADLRQAAEQGYAEAQCKLGACYFRGRGVTKNMTEAVKWFRKSVEHDYAAAQLMLGICYEFGNGIKQSRSEAIKWYRKAAAQGNKDAIERLRALGE